MGKADEVLIKRMLCREHAAMQTLLERYGDLIKSVVYRWFGALIDEREDCINEALFKIWQNIAQYDPEKGDLRCWIAAICRYEALDRRRKYAARPEIVSLESQLAQGVEPIASQVCDFSTETEEMLLMLPERDRALLIALYANGESVQVHVEEREETAQNENAVFAVTLDQVLMDTNGIGLLSFSIANNDGRPVNRNDIESLDVKSNVGQIYYSYYYECADDTITALQIGLYTKSEPQQMTLELNGQNYLFEEIDVTESTSICWEESNAKLTPLGMSFDRTGSLNTAAESSTTATITYRDGSVEEMMVWGYGGAVDNYDAATADESRCMLELRPVRQINQADFSNYCIDLASVDSITIGDVTLFAQDGELT